MNETTVEVIDEGFNAPSISGPDWFVELINRLKQVITKLLIKFGIKIGM